jgi:hypothetical protein
MSAPLLSLTAARIVAGPAVLASSLTLALPAPRALLVGDAEPILALLLGRARLDSGECLVLGEPLSALRPGYLGLAPLEPPMPPQMSPFAYVRWSARLAGLSPAEAEEMARGACHAVGMGSWSLQIPGPRDTVLRRMTMLAHAIVASPAVVVVEAPLVGLDAQGAGYMIEALARVAEGRCLILNSPRPAPASPDEALVKRLGGLVDLADFRHSEPPAEPSAGGLAAILPADHPVAALPTDHAGPD